MDEESKKLLAGLCKNIKAMQAEIEQIKGHKVTHNKRQKKLFLNGPVKVRRRRMMINSLIFTVCQLVWINWLRCLRKLQHRWYLSPN